MIKRIREVIASPLVVVMVILGFILGFTAKLIYGKGYEEFTIKIIRDLHKFHKGHELDE